MIHPHEPVLACAMIRLVETQEGVLKFAYESREGPSLKYNAVRDSKIKISRRDSVQVFWYTGGICTHGGLVQNFTNRWLFDLVFLQKMVGRSIFSQISPTDGYTIFFTNRWLLYHQSISTNVDFF
jgi:hypothetical protein